MLVDIKAESQWMNRRKKERAGGNHFEDGAAGDAGGEAEDELALEHLRPVRGEHAGQDVRLQKGTRLRRPKPDILIVSKFIGRPTNCMFSFKTTPTHS